MTSKLRRFAAAIAAAATAPVAAAGIVAGAAQAQGSTGPGTITQPTYTYTTAPPPITCLRRVEINDVSAYEGNRTSESSPLLTPVAVSVTSTNGCTSAGSVSWRTVSGTANSYDYESSSGTLTFAAGSSSTRTIFVYVNRDGSPGPNEYFNVVLVNPSSTVDVDDSVGRVTILNDDNQCIAPPELPPGYPDWHCME